MSTLHYGARFPVDRLKGKFDNLQCRTNGTGLRKSFSKIEKGTPSLALFWGIAYKRNMTSMNRHPRKTSKTADADHGPWPGLVTRPLRIDRLAAALQALAASNTGAAG
jgi:hypothetical protein